MGIIADIATIGAALVDADVQATGGLPVGVDVRALMDQAKHQAVDLQRTLKEVDRVIPAGTSQTALTTLIAAL